MGGEIRNSAGAGRAAKGSRGFVLREVECKTILNRSSLGDYSLNCYTGCAHGCIYCYARYMQRFHPHPEPWGEFVDIKANAVEALARQLRRARPGSVFVSSACDGWQQVESRYELTRRCCELLIRHGFEVSVLTKSALVLRDLDIFRGSNARIGVTVTTLDERLRVVWEPKCSRTESRFRVLEEARRTGLRTGIMFGPLLPFLSDGQASIDAMFRRAAELDVDTIWVDALNARPLVWPSVSGLLERHFPKLRSAYGRILYDGEAREAYIRELRERVAQAASRFSLAGRVTACL